jgi:hypothetical protein
MEEDNMKEVVKAVDIELSKEETIILYKAKLILRELGIRLKRIETKRQPNSGALVEEAQEKVNSVMNSFGAWIDGNTDKEVQKLDDKLDELDRMEDMI